jgi:hypothetical protein
MGKNFVFIIFLMFLILSLGCCTSGNEQNNEIDYNSVVNNPVKTLNNYEFDPKSKLISRVNKIPDFYLEYLRKIFDDDSFIPYIPTTVELSLFDDSLKILPPLHHKLLKERLIGIYFVDNYNSSGATDWVLDEEGNVYFIFVFNSQLFVHNISDWLTYRENSCFRKDDLTIDIEIDCGEKYLGIDYILLHESTHAVDYIRTFTPYVSRSLQLIQQKSDEESAFTEDVWKDYFTPISRYDYPYRKGVTFYGVNPNNLNETTPKISNKNCIELYRQLSATPFVSVYGSLSWTEDFADFVSFYHLTNKLKQPYVIRVIKGNTQIYSYEPMKSEDVKGRISDITSIYLIPD